MQPLRAHHVPGQGHLHRDPLWDQARRRSRLPAATRPRLASGSVTDHYCLLLTLLTLWVTFGTPWNLFSGYNGLVSFGYATRRTSARIWALPTCRRGTGCSRP